MELRRAPVEAHVEQFFLESIYYTWKATGDTKWMAGKLNAAAKAVHYVISDPYRWSEKYQLIKRGYTIDTWDFLSDSEAKLVDGDIMKIDLKATHFGIFFGDNANMIVGLHRLVEMLKSAGRESETAEYLQARRWDGETTERARMEWRILHALDSGRSKLKIRPRCRYQSPGLPFERLLAEPRNLPRTEHRNYQDVSKNTARNATHISW